MAVAMNVLPSAFRHTQHDIQQNTARSGRESAETNPQIDLQLAPQRFDYTSAFDTLSYSKEALNTRFLPVEAHVGASIIDKSVSQATNVQLLAENQQQRDEIAELRRANDALNELLRDLKDEHYADFQVVLDACRDNFIPTERDGKEISLAQLLRVLLQQFRVQGASYKTEEVIYRCRDESALLRRIDEKDAEIARLSEQIRVLEEQIKRQDARNAALQHELNAATQRERQLELTALEGEEQQIARQLQEDTLALRTARLSPYENLHWEFELFSRAIQQLARILEIQPQLSIADVVWQINAKVTQLKASATGYNGHHSDSNAPNDDFASYVTDVLHLDELSQCERDVESVRRQQEIELIFAYIDKIAAGMRFRGSRAEILRQVWEHFLDE